MTAIAPERTEAPEYYFKYINLVPSGDILAILNDQLSETLTSLRGITEEQSLFCYAPGKWSVRQVVNHLNDAERVFAFRALWFARGFQSPLPSFDEGTCASHAPADARSYQSHLDEFRAVRTTTVQLFRHLPPDGWLRSGVASGHTFTVRALAYIIAGHVVHHTRILNERYWGRPAAGAQVRGVAS